MGTIGFLMNLYMLEINMVSFKSIFIHYSDNYKIDNFYKLSVRNILIMFALFSMLGAVVIFVTSFILIRALRKEYEKKMLPWLWSFAIFTMFRFLAFLFFSIVNDLYFGYNITLSFLWLIFSALSFYGWLVVYSLYIELSDLTRLEDLAHLRVSFYTDKK